jgi:hypothetical protein
LLAGSSAFDPAVARTGAIRTTARPGRVFLFGDNDGTVRGGVTPTGSPSGQYNFDGMSGYISVPDSNPVNPGSASFTCTVVFSLQGNPPSGDYDLVRKGLAGTKCGDCKMEVLASGKALRRLHGSTAAVIEGGTNLGNGTHTVSCVKEADKVRLVVDGSTRASKSVHVGSIANSQPVILAAKPGDDLTKGLIDDISITG